MPIYEYKSEDGHVIEKVMGMNDAHPTAICIDRNGSTLFEWDNPKPVTISSTVGGFDTENYTRYERVFGNNQIQKVMPYPYPSLRMAGKIDPADAEIKDVVVRGVPHEQVPIIRSPQHERELMAKYKLKRD